MRDFNNTNIAKEYKGSALAIGNFDGVHLGHQKVFKKTREIAKRKKIKFGVLTFTPLPVMFFNKKIKNYRLASESQKLKLFKKNKVDFVINIEFNKSFFKISAENFIKKILYKKLKTKLLVVSNNFKFGRNRKGDVTLLKKFSHRYGYSLLNIDPFKHSKKIVSSTKIRKHLMDGNIYLANTAHTSSGSQPISSNTDVAKWGLIVDAAAASTSATAAATSASQSASSAVTSANSATASTTSATASATSATASAESSSSATVTSSTVSTLAASASFF